MVSGVKLGRIVSMDNSNRSARGGSLSMDNSNRSARGGSLIHADSALIDQRLLPDTSSAGIMTA